MLNYEIFVMTKIKLASICDVYELLQKYVQLTLNAHVQSQITLLSLLSIPILYILHLIVCSTMLHFLKRFYSYK